MADSAFGRYSREGAQGLESGCVFVPNPLCACRWPSTFVVSECTASRRHRPLIGWFESAEWLVFTANSLFWKVWKANGSLAVTLDDPDAQQLEGLWHSDFEPVLVSGEEATSPNGNPVAVIHARPGSPANNWSR